MWDKRRSFRVGRKEKFRVGKAKILGTKGEVLELGERRHCGMKGHVQSWESRDISDKRRISKVGRAEILGTKGEV